MIRDQRGLGDPPEIGGPKVAYICPECAGHILATQKALDIAQKLDEALRGIIDIGKRDMSNPKYDAYFEFAEEVLGKV
jgi:hypothetical protein